MDRTLPALETRLLRKTTEELSRAKALSADIISSQPLSDAAPPDTTIVTAVPGWELRSSTAFRNKPGQRIFLTSGFGATWASGLPAAIRPALQTIGDRPWPSESDGSLQLNLQELATLVAQHLPITLIIMNNRGYASIRNTQRNYFSERYIAVDQDSGLFFPDLERLARARPTLLTNQQRGFHWK